MVISCPACQVQYRINPATSKSLVARVKCPNCTHVFEVSLAGEQAPPQPAPVSASPPLVLVVDDARFFREMIREILKELPITLALAADGNEAWQQIASLSPQLILLDLNIPGRSGKEIVQELKQSKRFPQVKILAMSAVERGAGAAEEMRQIGADDFISKSFKPRELQDRVRKLLAL
jgi:predicted Zn finger-like uncharacterized protein